MNRVARFFLVTATVAAMVATLSRYRVAADDWLPIPPEDLAMKDNPANPGADAMVLYRDSAVSAKDASVGGDEDQEYVRIKIFTQAGVKKGDVEIRFFKDENDVKDVRGRTIHPDGSIAAFSGKVLEKEIVRLSGYRYLAKTFSLPDVQPGSIIEYKYRIQGNPHYLHDESWIVSTDLFTREAHFSYIPYQGYSDFVPMFRTLGLPAEAKPECAITGKCTMTAHNIPAVVDEPLMPPERILEARVEFHYRPVGDPSSETPQAFWSRITKKWNGELEHFIDKKSALNAELSRILSPGDTPEVKLRKIYARTQSLRNLSMEDPHSKQENKQEELKRINNAEDVLTNGYGSAREINFLFVGLARTAGFDATEVYLATRNDHLFHPEAQDTRDLNADVVWASAAGKEYYLDPGAKYFPFGMLPWYETGDQGMRLGKKGEESVTTPEPSSDEARIVRKADFSVNDRGDLSGLLRVDFNGREGAMRREENRQEDEAGREKNIEDEIKSWLPANASLEDTKVSNWDNLEEPLHAETTLKITGFAGSAGRRILLPAEPFHATQVGFFEPARRVNTVYIHFPYEEADELSIRLPDGYKIASLPAPPKVDPGIVTYQISTAQHEQTAEIKRGLVVRGMVFPKESYLALRAFFNTVKADDDSQIVLQNADSAKN